MSAVGKEYGPHGTNEHLENGAATYHELYKQSIADPDTFWGKMAEKITWMRPYDSVKAPHASFASGDNRWFEGGRLNISHNCIDRHIKDRASQTALLWEGDDGSVRRISYLELLHEVSRCANYMLARGVRKGDTVCVYMPMVPEAAFTMLACARIGAIHSVVFAGFSAEALRSRILDCKSRIVFTSNQGVRGGRRTDLKRTVDEALRGCTTVETVCVLKRTDAECEMSAGRDEFWTEVMLDQRPYCPPVEMDSEDPFFILYTSGSTGNPKGMLHTTGGYLVYAATTHRYVFDYREGDVYACVADVGWITGHTYVVYGPLCNGATSVMFESMPNYPDTSRYWDLIEKHKINSFYTAPTAIRALMRYGDDPVKKHDLSSLRVLGTVGEPINPASWWWYYNVVGGERCTIVDTYWQTETGGHIITGLPGAEKMKPGSASLPFFGIDAAILDPTTGARIDEPGKACEGVLGVATAWPALARTVWGDHSRYMRTYFEPYDGFFFTGDGASKDEDGFVFISGRVDDVINKAGHRLGTAEVESALVQHPACSEAAVVAIPDEVKGQGILAYCTLKQGYSADDPKLVGELRSQVRKVIGPIATPDLVVITPSLPKTRSGKIMRRILRKIGEGVSDISALGDISTLADPTVVEKLIAKVLALKSGGK